VPVQEIFRVFIFLREHKLLDFVNDPSPILRYAITCKQLKSVDEDAQIVP